MHSNHIRCFPWGLPILAGELSTVQEEMLFLTGSKPSCGTLVVVLAYSNFLRNGPYTR
jgi:hypothetical protein